MRVAINIMISWDAWNCIECMAQRSPDSGLLEVSWSPKSFWFSSFSCYSCGFFCFLCVWVGTILYCVSFGNWWLSDGVCCLWCFVRLHTYTQMKSILIRRNKSIHLPTKLEYVKYFDWSSSFPDSVFYAAQYTKMRGGNGYMLVILYSTIHIFESCLSAFPSKWFTYLNAYSRLYFWCMNLVPSQFRLSAALAADMCLRTTFNAISTSQSSFRLQ